LLRCIVINQDIRVIIKYSKKKLLIEGNIIGIDKKTINILVMALLTVNTIPNIGIKINRKVERTNFCDIINKILASNNNT